MKKGKFPAVSGFSDWMFETTRIAYGCVCWFFSELFRLYKPIFSNFRQIVAESNGCGHNLYPGHNPGPPYLHYHPHSKDFPSPTPALHLPVVRMRTPAYGTLITVCVWWWALESVRWHIREQAVNGCVLFPSIPIPPPSTHGRLK